MKSRCGDRLLSSHVKDRMVENVLQRRGDDSWPSGCAAGVRGFAVVDEDGRCHAAEWSLARSDGVGCTLNQAECIRLAGVGGEVVHLIVEQDAEFRDDHETAKRQVDGFRTRDGIASYIDHRKMAGA